MAAGVTDTLWSLDDMGELSTNGKPIRNNKTVMNWIVSKEGQRRMRVVKSSVGNLFYFEEETYRFDDDEYIQDYYWSPSYISSSTTSRGRTSATPRMNAIRASMLGVGGPIW